MITDYNTVSQSINSSKHATNVLASNIHVNSMTIAERKMMQKSSPQTNLSLPQLGQNMRSRHSNFQTSENTMVVNPDAHVMVAGGNNSNHTEVTGRVMDVHQTLTRQDSHTVNSQYGHQQKL